MPGGASACEGGRRVARQVDADGPCGGHRAAGRGDGSDWAAGRRLPTASHRPVSVSSVTSDRSVRD